VIFHTHSVVQDLAKLAGVATDTGVGLDGRAVGTTATGAIMSGVIVGAVAGLAV
jgi:hypothetical protein